MTDRHLKPLLVLGFIAALSAPVFASEQEIQKRAAEFRALIHADGSEIDGAKNFMPAAVRAAMMYDQWVPADYNRAIGQRTRANSDELNGWYKLATQELHWLRKEAQRLNRSCDGFGPGDARSQGAARKLAASARRFLGYIDKAPWDESLRTPMLNEVRQSQVAAIKDWDRLVRCVDGTAPAEIPRKRTKDPRQDPSKAR